MPKKQSCSVKFCKSNYGCKLFPFPCTDKTQVGARRRFKWLHAMGLSSVSHSKYLNICSKHFCENDFEMGFKLGTDRCLRLKRDAVPHMYVPNKGPCCVKSNKKTPTPDLKGVIVPAKSIAGLINPGVEATDDSVYLVQECDEMKSFMKDSIGAPIAPVKPDGVTASQRDVKVALPASSTMFQLCRVCFNPLINKESEHVKDLERDDVKACKTMLALLVPTAQWQMYRNSVICDGCLKSMETTFQMIQSYIATTEALNSLYENTKNAVPPNVDLVIMRKTSAQEKAAEPPIAKPQTPIFKKVPVNVKVRDPNQSKQRIIKRLKPLEPLEHTNTTLKKVLVDVKEGNTTFCCCVCYETFPDSKTLMDHLNSRQCSGPRQKSDIVITGL